MLTKKITSLGNSAAVVLPKDVLQMMNVQIGDEVELKLIDRTLVLRPVSEKAREELVDAAIDEVFSRRKVLLEKLAKGVDAR
jgi:putative addiction module antidote